VGRKWRTAQTPRWPPESLHLPCAADGSVGLYEVCTASLVEEISWAPVLFKMSLARVVQFEWSQWTDRRIPPSLSAPRIVLPRAQEFPCRPAPRETAHGSADPDSRQRRQNRSSGDERTKSWTCQSSDSGQPAQRAAQHRTRACACCRAFRAWYFFCEQSPWTQCSRAREPKMSTLRKPLSLRLIDRQFHAGMGWKNAEHGLYFSRP